VAIPDPRILSAAPGGNVNARSRRLDALARDSRQAGRGVYLHVIDGSGNPPFDRRK